MMPSDAIEAARPAEKDEGQKGAKKLSPVRLCRDCEVSQELLTEEMRSKFAICSHNYVLGFLCMGKGGLGLKTKRTLAEICNNRYVGKEG